MACKKVQRIDKAEGFGFNFIVFRFIHVFLFSKQTYYLLTRIQARFKRFRAQESGVDA